VPKGQGFPEAEFDEKSRVTPAERTAKREYKRLMEEYKKS
jgi:hypothetical protein